MQILNNIFPMMIKKIIIYFSININKNISIYKYTFFFNILLFLILFDKILYIKIRNNKIDNNEIIRIMKYLNITEYNKIKKKIKIAIYSHSLRNGGVEKITALLINYLIKIQLFDIYIFTDNISHNEYKISEKIKRINIINGKINELKHKLLINKIDIFIYQFYDRNTIQMLKSLKNIETIFYNHSCFLYWIYANKNSIFKNIYNEYKNAKYVISLVPFENDFLFKQWGINSINMNNFMTFDYDKIIPSNLSSKKILMVGRGEDKNKRFNLGINAMKYIKEKIPESEMIIISDEQKLNDLKKLVKFLNLEKNIHFVGYTSNPELYFKDASLHIFPSIAEAFPMVLSETKIYGIPSILVGINYVKNGNEGIYVIYDDQPETIAKIAIKILNDEKYRKRLGKAARRSMKKFNNEKLANKWIKLILSVYFGNEYYVNLCSKEKYIKEKDALSIIEKQVELIKMRQKKMINLTVNDILNFTFMIHLK